jgi:hypothetical protein
MKKLYEVVLALVTWIAIILQFYLADNAVNFISYFTILCNVLIAVSLSVLLVLPKSNLGKFFSLITVRSAIALNILIVGLVYNTVLRGIWEPKGWQLVADNLLHVAVPIFYLIYWLLFIPKGTLKWKDGIAWAYFPLIYLIYSLIRGHFVGWYPYPFLDVAKLGYTPVFINAGFVVIAFVAIALLMIWADRLIGRKETLRG